MFVAESGIAAPANTVAGSVFTDNWPAGWNLWGVTREGHTLNVEIETDQVIAAEYIDALLNVTTGRTITAEFDVMQVHMTNMRRAFNGGTINTTGSGATLLSTYTLPAIGQETRRQVGWESVDGTERWWGMQAFQTGSVGIQRRRGADNASLPLTFTLEPDSNSQPIYFANAGVNRG